MSYKVTYFTFKGLGEPVRFMLAYGNVDFIDNRIEMEDFQKLKPSLPLGQLPILEVDGRIFNQSIPICRYLGHKFGIAGDNDLENYEIDCAVATVHELRSKITNWYYLEKQAITEYYERLNKEIIPFYLSKLEEQAKKNGGHLALKRTTWGDVFSMALIDYCNSLLKRDILADYPNLTKVYSNVVNAEGVKKYLANRPADKIPEFKF